MTSNILDQHYDDLIDIIYKIPLDGNAWHDFSKKIREILNISYVHIQAVDFSYQVLSYSHGEGEYPLESYAQAEMRYLHYPKEADPRWAMMLNPERKGWYQCHTHVSNDFVDQSDLYQNILLPIGLRYVASHALIQDEKLCVFWSLSTSQQRKYLNSTELQFLDRLIPHLERVMSIQRHLYEFSAKAIVGYALIDKLSQPIMLLNLSGQMVHCNQSAYKYIAENDLIKVVENQLIFPQLHHTQFLEQLYQIEALFRLKQDMLSPFPKDYCIQMIDAQGDMVYVFMSLLVSEQEKQMFGIRPLVMLRFYHPRYANDGLSYLYKVFDCLNTGVILLDDQLRLFYTNPWAKQILSNTSLLKLDQGNRLKTHQNFQMKLNCLIFDALSDTDLNRENQSDNATGMALFDAASQQSMLLNVMPIAKATCDEQPLKGIVALFINQPHQTHRLEIDYLKAYFKLSKRELAVCELFVNGMNLEQISENSGITLETTRTYLKRIFVKTQTNSQSELMRVLLHAIVKYQYSVNILD